MKNLIIISFIFSSTISFVFSNSNSTCDVHSHIKSPASDAIELRSRPCDYLLDFMGKRSQKQAPDLASIYGLQVQTYTVTTQDGYKLAINRIPAPGKVPVLLVPGVAMAPREFFINCGRRAIGVRLADEDFDVWMLNPRGTLLSLSHETKSHKWKNYWSFSLEEIIKFDIPITIDYILNVTGQKKLNWIGASLGYSPILGLLASKPEYNSKVNVGITLGGPTGLVMSRKIGKTFSPYWKRLQRYRSLAQNKLIPLMVTPIEYRHRYFCLRALFGSKKTMCNLIFYAWDGYDPDQVDLRTILTMLGAFPAPTSVFSFTQYLQSVQKGKFSYFDYGDEKRNLKEYGQPTPPVYDLEKITATTVNFWGRNDQINVAANTTDIKFGSNFHDIQAGPPTWNNLDFLYGRDADVYVYDNVINILKGCQQGSLKFNI